MTSNFSHLHLHTEYSLLNGALRVKNAVKAAKEKNMPALALTDYGNIFGAVEFYQEAVSANIKPIIGAEVYLPSHDDFRLKEMKKGQHVLWHLVLLVKSNEGYKNLSRILTQSYLEGFYYKPRIDKSLLKEFKNDLICLSSGFTSELHYHLYQERPDKAKQAIEEYLKIFGDDFYIEISDNEIPLLNNLNNEVVGLAREMGVPLVATNNVHYLNRDDAEAFEVLRSVQLMRTYESDLDSYHYSTDAYHFASQEEMQQKFSEIPEALQTIPEIVEQCHFEFDFKTYHFPKFETPKGLTLDDMLIKDAFAGLEKRWPAILKLNPDKVVDKKLYEERLKTELDCITKMGFSGYFLIVADFIQWAKQQNIPVGPGRGSAAGSLVAYAIEITDIDPIPFDLLFERFLNPERISMPDVDVDFCQDRRSEVIEYVTKKYGNVSQIITFGKMKAKAVIRDVGRVMDLEYEYVDKIAKLIPNALNITLPMALEQEELLSDLYKKEETVTRLIDTSLKLEGMSRHASVHAAGVVIAENPLTEYVPLYKGSKDDVVAQFDMKSLEKIGLIKFDFLGLKTLTVIQNAIRNIKTSRNVDVDMTSIPLNDIRVYEELSLGKGTGVFQLESSGMRDLMERLKPSCFEDIVPLVALYRPGPLGSGMVDDFIQRKKGNKKIEYDLPELEPILKSTYGVIVYQEQVMQIAAALANYSMGEADLLRRAMGKKKAEEMDKQRVRFLEGAKENKIDTSKAEKIFDLMARFAEYGFNKSHSVAYALVSYHTAYLKTYYYPEYMASLLSSEMDDSDKILLFSNDCKHHETQVLPPDVNESSWYFSVEGENVRYGLGALKGVGKAAVESIIEAREEKKFQSLFDFCSRVDLRRVTKKVIDVLIKAGAFDFLDLPRKGLANVAEAVVSVAVQQQKNERMGQADLFADVDASSTTPIGVEMDREDEWTQSEKLAFEKEAYGFYFSSHPLQSFSDSLDKLTTHKTVELKKAQNELEVTVGGVLTQCRVIRTKKGDPMAFATLEDLFGQVEVIIFPRSFQECREHLSDGEPFIVKGKVDQSGEGGKIILESMSKLTETLKTATRSIHLSLNVSDLTSSKTRRLLEILKEYKGKSSVFFHLEKAGEYQSLLELERGLSATACEPLQFHIDRLFDRKVVSFH